MGLYVSVGGLPLPSVLWTLVAALVIVLVVVAYAVSLWKVLEDRPDPMIAWRARIWKRKGD